MPPNLLTPLSASRAEFPLALFFFFNDTAPTEIYTLSLHDPLPIFHTGYRFNHAKGLVGTGTFTAAAGAPSVSRAAHPKGEIGRAHLNSSHSQSSYAVFPFKKKQTRPAAAPAATVRLIRPQSSTSSR